MFFPYLCSEFLTRLHHFLILIIMATTNITERLKSLIALTNKNTERLKTEIRQGVKTPNAPLLMAEMAEFRNFLESLTEEQKAANAPFVKAIELYFSLDSSYTATWLAMAKR